MTIAIPIQTSSGTPLLQIIQDACNELALATPTSIVGNSDPQVKQLLALANREGKDFASFANKNGGWQDLRGEYIFSLQSGVSAYNLPSDFAYLMTQTAWDRAFKWQILGPLDAQEWQVLKSGISPTGPRRRFRIFNNQINIDPTPASGDTGNQQVIEYYSNGWCISANGAVQTRFAADTDFYRLDDDCMTLGVIWRFLAAKGMDYQQAKQTWVLAAQRAMSRDGGNRNLPLNAQSTGMRLLNNQNVPDTNYGS